MEGAVGGPAISGHLCDVALEPPKKRGPARSASARANPNNTRERQHARAVPSAQGRLSRALKALALTDEQLTTVFNMAAQLASPRRRCFLEDVGRSLGATRAGRRRRGKEVRRGPEALLARTRSVPRGRPSSIARPPLRALDSLRTRGTVRGGSTSFCSRRRRQPDCDRRTGWQFRRRVRPAHSMGRSANFLVPEPWQVSPEPLSRRRIDFVHPRSSRICDFVSLCLGRIVRARLARHDVNYGRPFVDERCSCMAKTSAIEVTSLSFVDQLAQQAASANSEGAHDLCHAS